jgi:hypothetical protein
MIYFGILKNNNPTKSDTEAQKSSKVDEYPKKDHKSKAICESAKIENNHNSEKSTLSFDEIIQKESYQCFISPKCSKYCLPLYIQDNQTEQNTEDHQLFLYYIPQDVSDKELIILLYGIGRFNEFRLIYEENRYNYAFVNYFDKELAWRTLFKVHFC